MTLQIKPNHKVITDYYEAIHQAKDANQLHEGAVAPHFAALLRHCLSQFPNGSSGFHFTTKSCTIIILTLTTF